MERGRKWRKIWSVILDNWWSSQLISLSRNRAFCRRGTICPYKLWPSKLPVLDELHLILALSCGSPLFFPRPAPPPALVPESNRALLTLGKEMGIEELVRRSNISYKNPEFLWRLVNDNFFLLIIHCIPQHYPFCEKIFTVNLHAFFPLILIQNCRKTLSCFSKSSWPVCRGLP